jgi:hypothetical protein
MINKQDLKNYEIQLSTGVFVDDHYEQYDWYLNDDQLLEVWKIDFRNDSVSYITTHSNVEEGIKYIEEKLN